jgi:hypothetical protein
MRWLPLSAGLSERIHINLIEVFHGHRIYRCNRHLCRPDLGHGGSVRTPGSTTMTIFYLIGALAAGGLLVYLLYALLKAEEL